MADHAPSFRAVYEHDPVDGAWLVRVEGLDGCHTYAWTKQEATERIFEALALWLDCESDEVALTHE
jgi:predicted RNase H-like HicB family nuclease